MPRGAKNLDGAAGLELGQLRGALAPDLEHEPQGAGGFVNAADGDGPAQGVAGHQNLGELAGLGHSRQGGGLQNKVEHIPGELPGREQLAGLGIVFHGPFSFLRAA